MAGRTSRIADEYAGTDNNGSSDIGATDGPSGPIDPATVDGSGNGGSGGSGPEQFDPAIHVGTDKRNRDGTYTRKRGRKSGSAGNHKARSQKAASDLGTSIEALSRTLVIVHTGIAAIAGLPELTIDKAEGDMLASASANVLAQFDITPDPKTQAVIGLIMACGAVYGPRVLMYRMRVAQEAKEGQPDTAGVYNPDGTPAGTTNFSVVN